MVRPVKPRQVENMPQVTYFKPVGVPMMNLEEVILRVDEFEALRLKDMEKLEQHDCALRMGVAQSTFQRILTAARHKMVKTLVEGKALRIEGGEINIAGSFVCRQCSYHHTDKNQNTAASDQNFYDKDDTDINNDNDKVSGKGRGRGNSNGNDKGNGNGNGNGNSKAPGHQHHYRHRQKCPQCGSQAHSS